MIGVILAAGMAKRLRPLTDVCPKCLLKVGNKTLLARIVDAMRDAGCAEFVIVTGYKEEMIRQFMDEHYPQLDVTFLDNTDYEHNNNIYSLWMAGKVVKGKEFLLMDSDILCDPEAVKRIAVQSESALAMQQHELGEEEMKVVVDEQGCITQLTKGCNPTDAIGESVGIEKITESYSRALFQELEVMIEHEGLINVFYELAFERLIPQGFTFKVVDVTDCFSMELDTPEDFERAKELIPETLF